MRMKCKVEGCEKLGRNKGLYKGNIRYGNECDFHHKKVDISVFFRKHIPNKNCEICGWNRSYCDRHRLVPKKGYVKENVIVLCPNCHREAHHNNLPI